MSRLTTGMNFLFMTSRWFRLFSLSLVVPGLVAISLATETPSGDADVIRSAVPLSTLIISGKFEGTSAGGGGATSRVEVREVLKAPKGFQAPKRIAVYWLSAKDPGAQRYTNSFLFFLRPATTNEETGYRHVTGKARPFVLASETNVRRLRSQLPDEK